MTMADKTLTVDLLANDKGERATKSFADNLDKVGDAADSAGKSTKKLGEESDRAKDRIAGLDSQAKTIRQNLAFLHQAFGDAADDAERMDITKGIRKAEAELKRVVKSRDVLKAILPDPDKSGRSIGAKLGDGIGDGLASVSGKLGTAVGPTIGLAIAAAAAPILVGTLGTALAAGSAAGVLGVGIMAAVKSDQKIKDAGAQAGSVFVTGLQTAAQRALSGRILGVIGDLAAAGDRLTDKLGTAFSKLGPYIRPFTKDIIAAGEAVTGSLIDSAGKSGPALLGLGKSVRLVADGVGNFISIVSNGGPEAAANLQLIAGATKDFLTFSGTVLTTLNKLGDMPFITGPALPLLRKHYSDVAKEQKALADGAPDAAAGIKDMGQVAAEAAPPLRTAADALKDIVASNKALFDSTTAVAEATDRANLSFAENGKTINANTAAGRANREALSSVADAMNRKYEASLKVNGEGPKTDAVARKNIESFRVLAERLTGSRQKARALADQLLAIPDVKRNVTIIGLSQAKIVARRINETLASIKNKNVHINYITASGKSSSELRANYEKGREYGGPVRKNQAYVVGEKRAEVFVPDQTGTIIPSIEQFMQRGGGGGGSGTPWRATGGGGGGVIRLIVSGGGEGKVAELINYLFRNGMVSAVPG